MKKVSIRFYEELNDFLPENREKVRFVQNFNGRPSVKDFIESLGVPHVEVDLVLVNGISVNFSYVLEDNDDISVYPEFESFDITGIQKLRTKTLRNPKFILDVHLGTLARYMRMAGFNTLYKNNYSDDEIVKISLDEERTILTRDAGILKRSVVQRGYFVRNTEPGKQIEEVIDRFNLAGVINKFSRCLECNSLLEKIPKEEIIDRIPEKVRISKDIFFICRTCNKIYWYGSHLDNMEKLMRRIIPGI